MKVGAALMMNDELLIQRFQEGNSEAFNELAARYQEKLHRMAYRMLGSHHDAMDAVQEILLRLLRSLPSFRGEAKFSTWLYRLASNTIIDYRRRLYRREPDLPLEFDLQIEGPNTDPDSMCEAAFKEYLIDQGLKQLPEAQRLLVVLRDREGLANQEVADILGIDIGTLKSRLHRARGALRRILEEGVVVEGQERQGRFQLDPGGSLL